MIRMNSTPRIEIIYWKLFESGIFYEEIKTI